MGGVYVFDENDATSMLQNPAYLCYTKGMNISALDVRIGVGDVKSYMDLTNDGKNSIPNPEGLAAFSSYYGKDVWVGGGGYAAVTFPCFGVAGYYTVTAAALLHNPAYPQLNATYFRDYGANIGVSYRLLPNLSLGLAGKRVTRRGGNYVFGADALANGSLSSLLDRINAEGSGYGVDVGLAARAEEAPFNPTISLSWRDIGSMSFVKTIGDDAPERQKDNLTLGMTFDGSIPLLGVAAGVEYRHVTDANEQIGKKIHMGAELHLGAFDFRAGFYQGYTTYGFGMNLFFFRVDASMGKVEQGVYPGQNPSERVNVGLIMDLELDPNFNIIDIGGKKRRLKQRR